MKAQNTDSFVVTDKYLCSDDNCKTLKVRVKNTILGPQMDIKWYKPIDEFTTHQTYSAIDILESYEALKQGKTPIIDPKVFDDKIVIVGAAAKVKSLEDIKSTPIINNTHAGADIQATVISNLLENSSKYTITLQEKAIIACLLVLISTWIIAVFGLEASLITLTIMMITYLIVALSAFFKGTTIQIITPLVLILLTISAGFTFRFLIEGRKKEQIQKTKTVFIFEGEKSCLICDGWYGDKNISVATCGNKLNKFQINLLLKLGVQNAVLCYDRMDEKIPPNGEYFNKLYSLCKKYSNYMNFSFIYDRKGILEYKAAPVDSGKEIFEKLLEERVIVK